MFRSLSTVKTELKSPATIVDANGLPLGPSHLDSTIFGPVTPVNLDATQSSNAYDQKQEYYNNYYNKWVAQHHNSEVDLSKFIFICRAACNSTRHHFIHKLMDRRTQRRSHRHRKFRRPTLTYHQATPQITQHNFTLLMETTTSDNLERRNKITRDITTRINTTVTTVQTTHLTSARPAPAAVRIFISQLCPKVQPKRSLARRRVSDTHRNRHYQFHQIPAITHRMQKRHPQPKERHVDDERRTRVPRDRRWMIRRQWRTLSRRSESLFGTWMKQSSFFIRS